MREQLLAVKTKPKLSSRHEPSVQFRTNDFHRHNCYRNGQRILEELQPENKQTICNLAMQKVFQQRDPTLKAQNRQKLAKNL